MKQAKVISDEEFKRLLTVVAATRFAERNRLAVMLSYYAGLRVGEIASLRFGQLFDESGSVRDRFSLTAADTKAKEARPVFVNSRLRKELEAYTGQCSGMREQGDYLLSTQKGTCFSANTLCQLFGELYRQAGIAGASSHSGRRWFITRLANSGVSAKVIMELAGHKNLATTQRYIEVNEEMMRKAVGLL